MVLRRFSKGSPKVLQKTFAEPLENLRRTFGEPSEIFLFFSFLKTLENLRRTSGEPSENHRRTFGEPPENLRRTFREQLFHRLIAVSHCRAKHRNELVEKLSSLLKYKNGSSALDFYGKCKNNAGRYLDKDELKVLYPQYRFYLGQVFLKLKK